MKTFEQWWDSASNSPAYTPRQVAKAAWDYIRDLDVEVENADHLEEIIYTNCQESVDSSFVMDMFTGYMDEVNWQEILDNLKG